MTSNGELGRAFLQERLALFGKVGALFLVTFLAGFNLVNLLNPRHHWTYWLRDPSNVLHAAGAAAMGAVWLASRRGRLSPRVLAAIDAAGFTFVCLTFVAAVGVADPSGHRKEAMLMEITNALFLRAVIVPSTAGRTLALGLVLLGPQALAGWTFEAGRGTSGNTLVRTTFETALFALIAVAAATLASRVIYGLRVRIAEAQEVGQYTLEYKIGEGAMGVVYRARHALLRRPTAVKLLPPERTREETLRRFEREVQMTSQLTHPNTVAIYDYGRTPEGVFYYAMEYLEGLTLDQLVADYGPQPSGRVIHLLRQICAALAEAHGLGLIHRDVKPANVIVCQRGGVADVAKVLDFGLIKHIAGDPEASHGLIVGTPSFMSPEAIRAPDTVDARSDLYGVGAIGYFLLTGQRVFEAETAAEIMADHVRKAPVPPSERLGRPIAPELERLLLGCLAKDPDSRPSSAQSLEAALAHCPGASSWMPDDARSWWRKHDEHRSPRAEGTESIAAPLRIDLEDRTQGLTAKADL